MEYEENPVNKDSHDYTKPSLSGFTGPINLGNPDEMSILDLAKKIIELTKSKSKIEYKSLPHDDPQRRQPDITLAKQKLGWKPGVPLEKGLKNTIQYFAKKIWPESKTLHTRFSIIHILQ